MDLRGEKLFRRPTRRSIQIGPKAHIIGRTATVGYLNHSCSPNAYFDFSGPYLRALQEIAAGEQVTVNYLATEYDLHTKFCCRCGARDCYGYVQGFKYLTRKKRVRLKSYLAPYLREKLGRQIKALTKRRILKRSSARARE